jgi:hypothetical protein
MYCPKCGQQQVDDNVRYCSRCGFPLGSVTELLASGGTLHLPSASYRSTLSPRQKGIRQGALMMLSTMLIVPLVIFLAVALLKLPGVLVPLTAVLLTMGGLLRILYAVFLEDNEPAGQPQATPHYAPPAMPARLSTPARGSALPPPQGMPAPSWRRPVDTSELVAPPSVTENTTRLLDERPDK